MRSVKQTVISMIQKMPDDATLEDIFEHLYIEQKILKAQEQLRSGNFYTHEQAKELIKKWQK